MTDEDTFQAALDAEPDNSAMRLVFADWLEERGDWRAAGYRWMAERGKAPMPWPRVGYAGSHPYPPPAPDEWTWAVAAHHLVGDTDGPRPVLWAAAEVASVGRRLIDVMANRRGRYWVDYRTRCGAEEALCRAVTGDVRAPTSDIEVGRNRR